MQVTEQRYYTPEEYLELVNPQVIIEVLSKSTKGYDREDKFSAYRTIPSFQEYLLIDPNRIYIEQFSKTGKKHLFNCSVLEQGTSHSPW